MLRCPRRPAARPTRATGFTLVEVLVVIGMISILVGIAVPTYNDYVLRGRLVDATTALSAMRARMEQYYQDNRSYVGGPCETSERAGAFTVSCSARPTATAYTVQALGTGTADGFVYSINTAGQQRTTSLPSGWGTLPTGGVACWIIKKGMTC